MSSVEGLEIKTYFIQLKNNDSEAMQEDVWGLI